MLQIDGVFERFARQLALVAYQRSDLRPAGHANVEAWVERNWPSFADDARALLLILRRLLVVVAERAGAHYPGIDADAAARIWRAAFDVIVPR